MKERKEEKKKKKRKCMDFFTFVWIHDFEYGNFEYGSV